MGGLEAVGVGQLGARGRGRDEQGAALAPVGVRGQRPPRRRRADDRGDPPHVGQPGAGGDRGLVGVQAVVEGLSFGVRLGAAALDDAHGRAVEAAPVVVDLEHRQPRRAHHAVEDGAVLEHAAEQRPVGVAGGVVQDARRLGRAAGQRRRDLAEPLLDVAGPADPEGVAALGVDAARGVLDLDGRAAGQEQAEQEPAHLRTSRPRTARRRRGPPWAAPAPPPSGRGRRGSARAR